MNSRAQVRSTSPDASAAGSEPRTTVPDASDRSCAWAVFWLLLAIYTLTFSGLPDNPDAEVEFQSTRSLARQGTLALGGTPEAGALVGAGFGVAPGGPGREGQWFGWFGVGQAAASVPFYWAGSLFESLFPGFEARHRATTAYGVPRSEYWQHLFVGWRNPLLAAATAALLALAARRLGASRVGAPLAALAYGLLTFAWPQARSCLSDVQATFCISAAFLGWLAFRGERRGAWPTILWASAALALAALTRVAVLPAACVLAAAWGIELLRARVGPVGWLCFTLPLAAGAALFLGANFLRFGSLTSTGYGAGMELDTFFAYPPHLGLAGLFLAPGKGLVWMAPLLCLAPWGLARAWRRGESAWVGLALLFAAAVLLPVAATGTWHGAWTYGPRYALPLFPVLWPAVALALDRLGEAPRPGLAARLSAPLLAALGLATSLPGVLVDHMTHQDLAMQAAASAWPEPGGRNERERDDGRFMALQWDWRFAAPWAHWRIALGRAQGAGDVYSAEALFQVAQDRPLEPRHDRERGWRHLAWVDLRQRLQGPLWPGPFLAGLFLGLAAWSARRRRRLLPAPAGGPG